MTMDALFVCILFTVMTHIDARCGHPGVPAHGKIHPKPTHGLFYNEGAVVTYNCRKGTVLHGNATRTCLQNGTWSSEIPFCLHHVPEKHIKEETKVCNTTDKCSNDVLTDHNHTTCASHSELKSEYLKLLVKSEERKYTQIAVRIHYQGWTFTSPLVNCNSEGSPLVSLEFWTSSVTICRNTFAINRTYLICEVKFLAFEGTKDCGTPDSPLYAEESVVTKTADNQTISKTKCILESTLIGNETRICNDLGKWSQELQYCNVSTCPDLKQKEPRDDPALKLEYDGLVNENGLPMVHTKVKYSCNDGFTLFQWKDERICQRNGTWTGRTPVCIPEKYLQSQLQKLTSCRHQLYTLVVILSSIVVLLSVVLVILCIFYFRKTSPRKLIDQMSDSFSRLNESLPSSPLEKEAPIPSERLLQMEETNNMYEESNRIPAEGNVPKHSRTFPNIVLESQVQNNGKQDSVTKSLIHQFGPLPSVESQYEEAADFIAENHYYESSDDDYTEPVVQEFNSIPSRKPPRDPEVFDLQRLRSC